LVQGGDYRRLDLCSGQGVMGGQISSSIKIRTR
jgi:hypothetical protein